MKAKMEVNEVVIKQALLEYFKKMNATEVTLSAYQNQDYGAPSTTITAHVTIDVGDVVAH